MAARYWRGTGDGNWGSTGNWSATSGGATGASVPTASDDVTFDSAGNNNCTINASARSCLSLIITSGYTSTITHSQILTVAGNITLGANYTIAGSSELRQSATGTITSNGKTWPNGFRSTVAITITLSGNFTVDGLFFIAANTILNKTTSEELRVNGGITVSGNLTGTSKIILGGGVWSGASNSSIQIDTDLDGDITLSGANVRYQTGTLKYLNGAITSSGATLSFIGSSTIDLNGPTIETVSFSTGTFTINSTLLASTITTAVSPTFDGSSGFTTSILSHTATGGQTVTLKESVTYTITTLLSCYLSRTGSIVLFTSSHASTKANLTLQNGATCQCLANFTRIDASGGRTIRSFNGTITDCNNVVSFYDLKTIAA